MASNGNRFTTENRYVVLVDRPNETLAHFSVFVEKELLPAIRKFTVRGANIQGIGKINRDGMFFSIKEDLPTLKVESAKWEAPNWLRGRLPTNLNGLNFWFSNGHIEAAQHDIKEKLREGAGLLAVSFTSVRLRLHLGNQTRDLENSKTHTRITIGWGLQ